MAEHNAKSTNSFNEQERGFLIEGLDLLLAKKSKSFNEVNVLLAGEGLKQMAPSDFQIPQISALKKTIEAGL